VYGAAAAPLEAPRLRGKRPPAARALALALLQGDTDTLFVHVPRRSVAEAFRVGAENRPRSVQGASECSAPPPPPPPSVQSPRLLRPPAGRRAPTRRPSHFKVEGARAAI